MAKQPRSTIQRPAPGVPTPERPGPMEAIVVPIDQIEPNPWNYNVQPDEILFSEVFSACGVKPSSTKGLIRLASKLS